MTRILLLGANGQVGWELQRSLMPLGRVTVCGRAEADLSDLDGLRYLIERQRPDIIVNAAAYTAVDQAEKDRERAWQINAEAVGVLAEAAARQQSWLIHYSTDYVFDGSDAKPRQETDPVSPLNEYGKGKLEGERRITQSGCRHLIFRTSWVYASRGRNFAGTMLRLARERDHLRVVADQVGAPTSAELIADVTALALNHWLRTPERASAESGIYHLVASGEASWHAYARYVVQRAIAQGQTFKASIEDIEPIPSAEYPVPARRPLSSRLDTTKLRSVFGLNLPDWQLHVNRMLDEMPYGK